MQIQVFADKHIGGGAPLIEEATDAIAGVLDRFSDHLTRVEAHITDVNAHKGGADDKQCSLEARPKGQPPVATTHRAGTIEDAYLGAAESMAHLLDSRFGRLHHAKGGESIRYLAAD
ncbi:ribosomal subunit interface protein [Nocardia huaxiensis]|uniref:Ribosomal subunit interface protein n=1 Tax=Nocardia huaxiensis TaxID=2755382 RepID=A0A7D6VF96_9NOCA|nr:ribosomal subunit interface protein [Nocardia huaxiensis]QLY33122.1 ribosomal subunit interface protein [Nocardia huaxiensis]UFS93107.1 ribosomal subunit interface protein [Nocardia huaxiensis]